MSKAKLYTAKKKKWAAKRYERRLQNGLCPMCGGKRTGEWITCKVCCEKARAYRKTLPPGYSNKGINEYRAKCRREGICYGCGRYIGIEGYKKCENCLEKDRARHARRYLKEALSH